jgi:hypothetical protein
MMYKILTAALIYPFAAALCSFASVDAGLLALVPTNSQVVVGINVETARNSDFGRYFIDKMNIDNSGRHGVEELIEQTGFDLRRDLQSLMFANTTLAKHGNPSDFLVLARGTFDQAKIRSAALAKGGIVQSYRGVDMYLSKGPHQDNGFAFLDSGVFIAGAPATLQGVITNRAATSTLNPQLQQLISQASGENDIWFASSTSPSFFGNHFSPDMEKSMGGAQAVQSIVASSGGVRFGSAVQVTIDAIARSDKDATALADVVRFAASMVQMKAQSDSKANILSASLSQLSVSTSGPSVHLVVAVPETSLEQSAETPHHRRRIAH